MNALLSSAFVLLSLGQTDPGTVLVVGGEVAPVTFALPSGTAYQLNYPTTPVRLWFDSSATIPANPATTYTATSKGDFNGDNIIAGDDIPGFTTALVDGPFNAEGDFDGDGNLGTDDIPGFVEALLNSFPADGVILYAEGAAASLALGDVAIDLLTDPDMDTVFTLVDTAAVTVVGIIISPTTTGPLGTPVFITMTPAVVPLAFDATTQANWEGVFQPAIGNPSQSFTITFNPSQFQESSSGQAIVVLGAGSSSNLPDFSTTDGLAGRLEGNLTLEVGGFSLKKPYAFTSATDAITWESIRYPDGPGGLDAPELEGEVALLNPWRISFLGIEVPSEGTMLIATGFHHAVVLRAEETPSGTASAPNTVSVALVSFDQAGVEIDRVTALALEQPPDDGDPTHIVYHNDLFQPVILVDLDLNKSLYPNVTLLKIEVDGSVVVAPSTN